MKELIEEIKTRISYQELKIQDLNDYTKENGNLKNILNAEIKAKKEHLNDLKILLKNIQEQESKPFDPLKLGLINMGTIDNYTTYLFPDEEGGFYLEEDICLFSDKVDDYFIWSLYRDGMQDPFNNLVIPNHRFGKELLKNLGVIDAY